MCELLFAKRLFLNICQLSWQPIWYSCLFLYTQQCLFTGTRYLQLVRSNKTRYVLKQRMCGIQLIEKNNRFSRYRILFDMFDLLYMESYYISNRIANFVGLYV